MAADTLTLDSDVALLGPSGRNDRAAANAASCSLG